MHPEVVHSSLPMHHKRHHEVFAWKISKIEKLRAKRAKNNFSKFFSKLKYNFDESFLCNSHYSKSHNFIQNFNFDAPSKTEEKYCQLGKGQFYRPYGILTDFISKCNINRRVSKSTWDCSRGNLATDWYVLPCLKLIDFNT